MNSMGLFEPDVPEGCLYRADLLRPDEERALNAVVAGVELDTFAMRGVVARRRVKFYGAV